MKRIIMTISIISGVAAVVCGIVAVSADLIAAGVEIRESQDDFIADLRDQGRWTSGAAIFAAISTLLQALLPAFHYLLNRTR